MKKINKVLLGAGSLASIIVPIATVVSCGGGSSSSEAQGSNSSTSTITANIDKLKSANLRGQGSSSVLPIIEELKRGLTTLQYDSTGSGDGLKVGTEEITGKDFGMTSSLKRPTAAQVDAWANKRTLTFAVDAIGMAINLPSGLTYTGERPIIDIQKLADLYDDNENNQPTWADLLTNESAGAQHLTDTPIAFGRTGGKSASGTADGFWHVLGGIAGAHKDENHSVQVVRKTAEANSEALRAVQNQTGSITYLSLGYALKNETNGVKVATIKKDANTEWVPSLANVSSKAYKWTRPFNIIYKPSNVNALEFAKFLLSKPVQDKIQDLNFVQLTAEQLAKQTVEHQLTDTDLAILGGEAHKAELATAVLGLEV